MRLLKYPKGLTLRSALYHDQFWVVSAQFGLLSSITDPAPITDSYAVINSESSQSFDVPRQMRYAGAGLNADGRLVIRFVTGSWRWHELDFLTGELRPVQLEAMKLEKSPSLPHSNYIAQDDNWVVMSGAAARTYGLIAMGPSAYADGVRLPPGNQRPDGHLVVYRRGGSARTLKVPGGFIVTNVIIAPDGLTALAAGNKAAVIIDLE